MIREILYIHRNALLVAGRHPATVSLGWRVFAEYERDKRREERFEPLFLDRLSVNDGALGIVRCERYLDTRSAVWRDRDGEILLVADIAEDLG